MRIPNWLLTDVAVIEEFKGEGAYGPVYAPPVEVKCRAEYGNRLVRDKEGREVVSSARLYFEPDIAISVDSRVTVSNRQHTVLQVQYQKGFGQSHIEVALV